MTVEQAPDPLDPREHPRYRARYLEARSRCIAASDAGDDLEAEWWLDELRRMMEAVAVEHGLADLESWANVGRRD